MHAECQWSRGRYNIVMVCIPLPNSISFSLQELLSVTASLFTAKMNATEFMHLILHGLMAWTCDLILTEKGTS